MQEQAGCGRQLLAGPGHYIKVNAYDATYTKQTAALSFIGHRPKVEPGFHWTGPRPMTVG